MWELVSPVKICLFLACFLKQSNQTVGHKNQSRRQ